MFDPEDFAVAENVQRSLLDGADNHHALALAEGVLALFRNNIDDSLTNDQGAETHA
ncbi:hypothetical protein [Rhodococcus kronopolitis]|uniref:Uncharacterized protein n=1 Tax=Rhodococcus kronopolitis TaxID=1460226 RepID=A0ABV9FVK3_9NOCA